MADDGAVLGRLPSMPNFHIRVWYVLNAGQIREIDFSLQGAIPGEDLSLPERARRAWEHRRWARMAARSAMRDDLERRLLRRRDMDEYGNQDGPSFEQVKQKVRRSGARGDTVWEEIVAGAWKTDSKHNDIIGKDVVSLIEAMCQGLRTEVTKRSRK